MMGRWSEERQVSGVQERDEDMAVETMEMSGEAGGELGLVGRRVGESVLRMEKEEASMELKNAMPRASSWEECYPS